MRDLWQLLLVIFMLPFTFTVGWGQLLTPFTLREHPCLEFSAAELMAWKKDPTRQGEITRLTLQGNALLAKGLIIPEKEGDWVFYYACPKDGARLRPETLERHICPTCGAVYTDDRTNAAYRTILNDQLNENCRTLALCYALTGEEKYARPVRDALLKLAQISPTLERHDRWGRRGLLAVVGGRRYAQHLDEAVAAIKLARAYDLAANAASFSAEDRKKAEAYLQGICREIQRYQSFIGERNNHQTWFNAAYATVAVATFDDALMRSAVEDRPGLLWQLEHSVTEDGLWYEGTMAYHFYALQAIIDTVDAVKCTGRDMTGDARLKSLWLGPLQLAYPNGQFPVMHDSDPGGLAGREYFYKWANNYFKDARFAAYAGGKTTGEALKSTDLKGIGLAILRRGAGDNANCAMIDYGPHGDGHGHPDKLNIVLYGLGQELVLDPGRITYSVPEYTTWCRTTAAHNTVAINQQNQRADTGRCLYFTDTDRYAATLTASDGAYPGYALRRFLLLTDNLLVDAFTIRGAQPATLDWFMHIRGAVTTDIPLAARENPLGDKQGYQHLTALKEGQGKEAGMFTATLVNGKQCRVYCLDDPATTLFTGMGIGYNLKDAVPFVLRRQQAKETVFLTVYDLSGDGSAVTTIEQVPVLLNGKAMSKVDAVGLRIKSAKGTMVVGLDLRDLAEGKPVVEEKVVERCWVE
ncbi:MAG: heparinase II/III domain-containing protein [Armatimonadota bacterium]